MKAIRRNVDVSRMARSVQRPGVDPREWCKYGVIQELGFDADHGVFADVKMMPNGEEQTCSIGSNYTGNGYGEWAGLEVGDIVKIEYPEGTAEATPVISERLWNASRKPPAQVQDESDSSEPTKDRVLVVKPGQKYRVYVTEGGEIDLFSGGSTFLKVQDGAVLIGDDHAAPVIPSNWATNGTLGLIKVLQTLAAALTTAGVTNTLSADLSTLPTAATTKGKIT